MVCIILQENLSFKQYNKKTVLFISFCKDLKKYNFVECDVYVNSEMLLNE